MCVCVSRGRGASGFLVNKSIRDMAKLFIMLHTVGPANKEVPESAIAAQPLAQYSAEYKQYLIQLSSNWQMVRKQVQYE